MTAQIKPSFIKWKFHFLLLACFAFYASVALGQMRQIYVDQVSTNNEIQKVSFYSASNGYVASSVNGFDWVGFTSDSARTVTKKYITLANVDYGRCRSLYYFSTKEKW